MAWRLEEAGSRVLEGGDLMLQMDGHHQRLHLEDYLGMAGKYPNYVCLRSSSLREICLEIYHTFRCTCVEFILLYFTTINT
jgi:hypothetical protein